MLKAIDILNSMKTDAPVFVGFSPRGLINEAVEIKRWGQFIVKFGSFKKCGYLATSANGFFINGGQRFFVLNLGERPTELAELKARFEEGLRALDDIGDIPFIMVPGEYEQSIHETILEYCAEKGTHALLDGPEELIEKVKEVQEDEIGDVGEKADTVEQIPEAVHEEEEEEMYENMPEIKGDNGVVIYPWIYLKDKVMGDFFVPPSGHVAGVFCRLFNENERPEFSTIEGTVLLKYKFSQDDIERYTPRGISFLKYPTKKPGLILK